MNKIAVSRNEKHCAIRGLSDMLLSQLDVDLKQTIIKCTQEKRLCEWHVSLAPSISYR